VYLTILTWVAIHPEFRVPQRPVHNHFTPLELVTSDI
jgi:hypothetical protein